MLDAFIGTKTTLPVEVIHVSWNDATLVISGSNWALQISSNWHLYSKEKLLCQSDDGEIEQALQTLRDKKLISIEKEHQKTDSPAYLVRAKFSDELHLKAFGDGEIYFGL